METFSALLALCAGNSPVPVTSPHLGQWRGALMFSLLCVWINDWVNNREAGDLRRHRGHYDVIVMASVCVCEITNGSKATNSWMCLGIAMRLLQKQKWEFCAKVHLWETSLANVCHSTLSGMAVGLAEIGGNSNIQMYYPIAIKMKKKTVDKYTGLLVKQLLRKSFSPRGPLHWHGLTLIPA